MNFMSVSVFLKKNFFFVQSVATTLDDAISLTSINNPINVVENGTTIDMNQFYVITGLREKNEIGENCNNWKSGTASMNVGDAMQTDRGWLRGEFVMNRQP